MLNIKYDPTRPYEEGQYLVELVTFNPTNHRDIKRYGYWCDLSHIKAGVIPKLVSNFPEEILDALGKYMSRKINKLKENSE